MGVQPSGGAGSGDAHHHRVEHSQATGQGVPQDYVQAHMWLNLAASQTDEERENAVIGRDRVADRMTPDQLAKVHRLAREWNAAPPLEQ